MFSSLYHPSLQEVNTPTNFIILLRNYYILYCATTEEILEDFREVCGGNLQACNTLHRTILCVLYTRVLLPQGFSSALKMWPKQYLTEFIKIYEDESCLWKVGSKYYHDKAKRDAGYAKLLDKMKELNPTATKDDVIKKINNLRSAFRKEIKKLKVSIKSGTVYKPKLWYFSQLSFLTAQDIPRISHSNVDIGSDDDCACEESDSDTCKQSGDEIVLKHENCGEVVSNPQLASTSTLSTTSANLPKKANKKAVAKGRKQTPPPELIANELEEVNIKRPRTEEDRFDMTGKTFAIKLRGLPRQQMLLAEKLMNDTLFLAEQGLLTLSHRLFSEESRSPTTTSTS